MSVGEETAEVESKVALAEDCWTKKGSSGGEPRLTIPAVIALHINKPTTTIPNWRIIWDPDGQMMSLAFSLPGKLPVFQ